MLTATHPAVTEREQERAWGSREERRTDAGTLTILEQLQGLEELPLNEMTLGHLRERERRSCGP